MFLTIFTRTFFIENRQYARPGFLAVNRASIAQQTDGDYDHVLLIDEERRGVAYADVMFSLNVDKIRGDYVYTLDDDNALNTPTFITELKAVAKAHDPDVIMFRANYTTRGALPDADHWNKQHIEFCHVSPFNCIVKCEWFIRFVEYWQHGGAYVGDFAFLKALETNGAKFYWYDGQGDGVMAYIQKSSDGGVE